MNRKILRLAVPNIISNLSIPMVGIVDIALMGHLGSVAYIGAISIGASIFSFIYAGLGFLRMGTSGFTAQSYGKRNIPESFEFLGRALFVAVSLGLLLILLQKPLAWASFHFIGGTEEVKEIAATYFSIRIWAAPATLSLYAITGWYIGMQNTRIPMWITLCVNLVNIAASVYFISHLGMKADGAALGTLTGQYCGLILAVVFLSSNLKRILKYWSLKIILNLQAMFRYMKLNTDLLIRSLILTGSFYFFNAISASLGEEILAVNSILLQFLWIFSFFIDGFAFAAEALTGKFVGARDEIMLKKSIRHLFFWGLGLSVCVSLIYIFTNQAIIQMLIDKPEIIALSKEYTIWIMLIPVISFGAFLWDGIYIGATESSTMRNMMLIASIVIFLPGVFLFRSVWDNHGLWLALLIFLLARGILLQIKYKSAILGTYKIKKNEKT